MSNESSSSKAERQAQADIRQGIANRAETNLQYMAKGRPFKARIFGTLGACLLRLLLLTYRWKRVGELAGEIKQSTPVLFAFWHDQQLLVGKLFWTMGRGAISKGLTALASRHSDGQIIAQIVENFGFRTVAGSTSRGGVPVLLALGKTIESGLDIGLAPDGPKGPPFQAKQGIVILAKRHKVSIIPLGYATKPASSWRFASWDKMFLPKPFAKISWSVGVPLHIDESISVEQGIELLNTKLNDLNRAVIADANS